MSSLIRSRAGRLEYSFAGPSVWSAPSLVFLHEGLGSLSQWRDFPTRLSNLTGCGALAYSRQGYGGSEPLPAARTVRYMHEEAEILRDLLRALNVRECFIVGHSDGASIALIYAASPNAVKLRGLILEGVHVIVEDTGVQSIANVAPEFLAAGLRGKLARHHKDVDGAFWGWNHIWRNPAFKAWDITPLLPAVRSPMLVLQGDRDEYGTWQQVEAIRRWTSAEVDARLLEDCGHAPHRDQRDLVLELMTEFIRAHLPA